MVDYLLLLERNKQDRKIKIKVFKCFTFCVLSGTAKENRRNFGGGHREIRLLIIYYYNKARDIAEKN